VKRQGRLLGRAGAVLAVALLGALGFAAPAHADGAVKAEEEVSTEACWLNLDTDELQCFDDRETLLAVIEDTGTALRFAPTVEESFAASSQSSLSGGVGLLATYFLATLYADSGYSGASLDITTSNSWMCSGTQYNANLSGSWNDRVSSFESYGGCRTRLSTHINQGGPWYGPYTSASSLGTFNDDASSYRVQD
jgi:hypothetical protein